MATFNTSIVVTAVDQASGVLGGISAKFQNLANSINANARSIARSTQVMAAAAVTSAVSAAAAPLQGFARNLLSSESEWSKAINRVAVATENQRELENRVGMQSEAVQAARHAANLRRLRETEDVIKKVAQNSIFKAAETANAFSDMVFAGISENTARAMLPLAARYAQAAELPIQQAAASLPRMVRGVFGTAAVQDATRAADLSRFVATSAVAGANASGASVRDIDEALRLASPVVLGAERRQLEREAARREDWTDAQRAQFVEDGLKRGLVNLTAQISAGVQNGFSGSEVGRALAATNARLGSLPAKAVRFLEANGMDPMTYQVLPPNAAERIVAGLRRQLPNLSPQAMQEIAGVYRNTRLSAIEQYNASREAIAQRGGAGGTAMGTQDTLKAVNVLREQQNAIAERTDIQRLLRDLEARGVNAATLKEVIGAYHQSKIAGMEGAEVGRIANEINTRLGQTGYLESQEAQRMAGFFGALEKLTGALDTAKRAFFTTFGEPLIELMGKAESALESLSNRLTARNPDGTFANQGLRDMAKYAAVAAGSLIVLAPILMTIGTSALLVWGVVKVFAAIAATAAAVVKGVGLIAGALMSIPVAIGAIVAAAAGWAIWSDLGGSLAPFLSAVQHVKDALASLWGAMQAVMAGDWSKAGELAMSALSSIGSALWSLGESLGKAALGALSAAWAGIQSWASDVAGRATNLAKNIEADFRAWTERTGQAIYDAVSGAFDSAVSNVSAGFGRLAQAFNANVVEPIKTAWQSVLDGISGAIDRLVARITGAIESLRSRLPSWAGGTAGQPQLAAPALPQAPAVSVPQVPLSYNVAPTTTAPGAAIGAEVGALIGQMGKVEGAAREAAVPAVTLAENAGKIAGQAAAAAANLDAVSRSLSALSNLRVSVPQIAPQAPVPPAAPAATPGQQGQAVQPFRSFADADVRPGGAMSRSASFDGQLDIRVRSERGTEARAAMQSRGDVRTKIDAGFNDAAWA